MDVVIAQELESVELMPDGEIRVRWARHVRLGPWVPALPGQQRPPGYVEGQENFEWHRAAFQPGDVLPSEVAAAGKGISAVRKNPAAEFMKR